ncbi:MAG: nitrilase-related carbon-nitrogen hydrolase, partial [Fibrobacterota bacterium]
MKKIRLALCQNVPGHEAEENVNNALDLVRKAAGAGADLVCLPEMFYYPYELSKLHLLASLEEDVKSSFSQIAGELGIHLCTGSFVTEKNGGFFNTTLLYGPDGELIHLYNKSHLFDVSFKGLEVKESDFFSAGNKVSCAKT